MISRTLTFGGVDDVTNLTKLMNLSPEDKQKFPNMYFPSYYEGNENFIVTKGRDVTAGHNCRVQFLLSTKNGTIISTPDINNCQLIPHGYLGRYEVYPDGVRDPNYRGTEPKLSYVCTYWVDIDSIQLVEAGIDELAFATLTAEMLPPQLVEAINSPTFKSTYFD